MSSNSVILPKAAVFIDAGHYHYRLFNKWRIDYKKLIQYFESRGNICSFVYYYEGIPSKNSYFHSNPKALLEDFIIVKKKKRDYFKKLKSFGFIVKYKPVHRIYDKDIEKYRLKCNFDVELTIDVMDVLFNKNIDVIILCSGDGDFQKLISYAKGKNKRTMVVGLKRHTSDNLLSTANEVIFLEAIQSKIEYK